VKRYFEAFAYPFTGDNGIVMVVGVAVLSFLPTLYSLLPLSSGYWGFGLGFVFLSYYAIYLRSILHSSMDGKEHLPPWPDWEHPEGAFEEIVSILAPFMVSFLPLILLRIGVGGLADFRSLGFFFHSTLQPQLTSNSAWATVASALLLIFGWLYLPMAVLVWTYYGGWSIFNPVAVARTAWRTGPGYLALSLLIAILISAAWSMTLLPASWLTTFGTSLLVFYALVVSMRMLGTHYNEHRVRLGWEQAKP
jgi:hypothetical protein